MLNGNCAIPHCGHLATRKMSARRHPPPLIPLAREIKYGRGPIRNHHAVPGPLEIFRRYSPSRKLKHGGRSGRGWEGRGGEGGWELAERAVADVRPSGTDSVYGAQAHRINCITHKNGSESGVGGGERRRSH